MAATNDTVADAQFKILLYIYACVILLCLTLFRSVRATLSVILPLTLVSILAYAMMAVLQIGLKTSTLPVAAFGVGIGVDYGIYIFSQLNNYLRNGEGLSSAYIKTLEANGTAVLVTGLTLHQVLSLGFFLICSSNPYGYFICLHASTNMVGAICVATLLGLCTQKTDTENSHNWEVVMEPSWFSSSFIMHARHDWIDLVCSSCSLQCLIMWEKRIYQLPNSTCALPHTVSPFMIGEFITLFWVIFQFRIPATNYSGVIGLICFDLVSTATLQVPCHNRYYKAFEPYVHRKLV